MKFIKQSKRVNPKISLILLDWSVRESFHLLHYLSKQSLPRHQFEVIVIEYYSFISTAIKKFADQVDTWFLLEMPKNCYYHKHLMYNTGIAIATGDIVIICDSDAMAKPTFLQSILTEFEKDPHIVLHLDQFRNNRKDFYPFCYPHFEEVIGKGCINNIAGKTRGLSLTEDLIHERNYGACLCARRADLITIGGADEHIDFVGHICGPYDLTFRLVNLGKREVWHQEEFLYHTWHPGQAGMDNYLGPHDGKHMSTTSLEAIFSKRVFPNVINSYIDFLASYGKGGAKNKLEKLLISSENLFITKPDFLKSSKNKPWAEITYLNFTYCGYLISRTSGLYYASPILNALSSNSYILKASNLSSLRQKIHQKILIHISYMAINLVCFFPYLLNIFLSTLLKKINYFLRGIPKSTLFELKIKLKVSNKINKFNLMFKKNYEIVNLLIRKLVYFIENIYIKIRNNLIRNRLSINRFFSLALSLNLVDKGDKRIFFLTNTSSIKFILLYCCIIFLRKNFITVKRLNCKEDLCAYVKRIYNSKELTKSFFIIDKTCFVEFGSDILRNTSMQSFII